MFKLILGACLGSTAILHAAQVFDPAAEFSATENPHGAWSYGYSLTLGSDLLAFKASTPATAALGPVANGLEGWFQNYDFHAPMVIHNPSTNKISDNRPVSASSVEAGGIALHPGQNNEYAVLRFTTPSDASYEIAGSFFGDNAAPTTTDVHVLLNGTSLFDGTVEGSGATSAKNFSLTRQLASGDVVDFAVGYGANGNFSSDLTGLNLNVTQKTGVFDAKSDFSTNNPSGSWSYGHSIALDSGFTPYPIVFKRNALDYWTASPGITPDPSVGHNPEKIPQLLNEIVFQPHELTLHPGSSDQYSIVRWTAPTSGKFLLQSTFIGEGGVSTTDVHIRKNGQRIFDDTINGRSKRATYSSIVTVSSGDIIDFAVGFGADQDNTADTTGLDVQLRPITQIQSTNLTASAAIQLSWSTQSGVFYQLQFATNIDASTWQDTGALIQDQSFTNAFAPILNPKLFYRLVSYK